MVRTLNKAAFLCCFQCCPCIILPGGKERCLAPYFRGFNGDGCSPVCLRLSGCNIAANVEKCPFVYPDFKILAQIRFLCRPVDEIRK